MIKTNLSAVIMLMLLAAGIIQSAQFPVIHKLGAQKSQMDHPATLLNYFVAHDAKDHLALGLHYDFPAQDGDCFRIGAITLTNGNSNGYWSYRQDPVYVGRHWAHVNIGISDSAPYEFDTDEIMVEIYRCGDGYIQTAKFPYKKHWRRISPALSCHKNWGQGCG